MEAGTTAEQPPVSPRRRRNPLGAVVREAGEMGAFAARAVLALRGVGRYTGEVLRQSAIIIVGSSLLLWLLILVIGAECGLFVDYFLRAFGGTAAIGIGTEICGLREMFPYMFGYMFAAKVGCGLVAEIGSMRIGEEIDALESVGIDPMRYLIATRLLATWISVPLLYVVGLLFGTVGSYLVVVVQLGELSQGGWESLHWALQDVNENLYSLTKAMVMATVIVLVGMYYGYRARGGPVGVGAATARSMLANIVLIHLIGSMGTLIFYGLDARVPLGG